MDDEVLRAINDVRSEVLWLAMFNAQALALLAGEDATKRAFLDDLVTQFEGMAESAGARNVMGIIRDAHDKMAAGFRGIFPDAGLPPG